MRVKIIRYYISKPLQYYIKENVKIVELRDNTTSRYDFNIIK